MMDELRAIHDGDQAEARGRVVADEVATFYLRLLARDVPEALADALTRQYAGQAADARLMVEYDALPWEGEA